MHSSDRFNFLLMAGGSLGLSALALASRCNTQHLVVSFNFPVLSVLAFHLLLLGSSTFWFPDFLGFRFQFFLIGRQLL